MLANSDFTILIVFLCAFFISLFSIPLMLKIAHFKKLYDKPNGRTSHSIDTPTLGGVAIFAGILIPLLFFANNDSIQGYGYLIACTLIIFFIGLIDDVYKIPFLQKILGQIFVIIILIFLGDFRFHSLYGFMNIYDISYSASIIISTFVFIVILNCINLIDGVDGLASGLSILISGIFSVFFYYADEPGYLILSISLFGSLVPFFIFNAFGKKNKLFMGDTGALVIGIISIVLVVKFNELSLVSQGRFVITASPAMSIAIFFIPLYDTLQVFIYRILSNNMPFNPDRNHLHHRLLRLGLTHMQTSFILIFINAIVIIGSYFMQFLGAFALICILLLIGLLFSASIWLIYRQFIKTRTAF